MKLLIAICLLLTFFTACKDKEPSIPQESRSYLDFSGMDTTVKPGDNFFEYANGLWTKKAVIPGDYSGWGSFFTLDDNSNNNMQSIALGAIKTNSPKGSAEQMIGDYYYSGMDTVTIEKAGFIPLVPLLKRIDSITNYKQLMNLVADISTQEDDGLLGFFVELDEKNSSVYIPILYQSGLSLPDREHYLQNDDPSVKARNALIEYASALLTLTGQDTNLSKKNANSILQLEKEIARSHRTPVELRDPQKNYNKMAVEDLEKRQPNIGWKNLFSKTGVKIDSVNMAHPGYFASLNKLLTSYPIETWKNKLRFEYIQNNTEYLSSSFIQARFNFKKVFSGRTKDSERWKKIIYKVDEGLGDIMGQLYVKRFFNDTAKQRMDELVNNLQIAFTARLNKLSWMGDSTRQKAIGKLNAFTKKVGYPSKWKTYDDVTIDKNNYFSNAQSVRKHERHKQFNKIGKQVDRLEWGLSVATVNAYYDPTRNEIVFPAAILQFPFFDVKADDAINYGAIGMVIGHEIIHGFDDQGSQYDLKGNMQNWWTANDAKEFRARTGSVVKKYNAFKILDSLRVNGELTLGENIADMGGLAIAYDAFKLARQGKKDTLIDGLTPDQRFFLGYAQCWRIKLRDETVRLSVNTDPHSPEMYRVNGPVFEFDPFYAAFNVREGDKMYIKPENRIRIW